MLSLVNSSDPSCSSSKVSEFRSDERDSDQLPLQEASPVVRFGEAQTTSFSIREHVFASRSENLGNSWPFPSQLLQLCLKHGIQDLLPPFEPPNSVRTHRRFIRSESEAEKATTSSSQCVETVLLDGEPNSNRTHDFYFPSKDVDGQDKDATLVNDVCEIDSTVTNHCDIERFSTPFGDTLLKKCRLILKPGVFSETSRAEEISTTSTASDIMASKVCPVCKAFSSTSNTTLNAHMDQCLSMESDATLAVDNMPKLKLKPKKKRLMEDIYATAPRCTLEDLDRRNGTTWATDLTWASLTAEASLVAKKLKLPQLDTRDEKSEGAVYVDSNGIKLRILSKFNDAPQVLSREEFRPRKNIKDVRDGKMLLIKNKKHFSVTYSKKMKLKLRNKKLSSLKPFKNELQAGPEAAHHEESLLEEEGSPVQLSGEADHILSYGSVTLKKWPSSKRSDLPKKVGKKDLHKILEQPKPYSQMAMLDRWRPTSDTPSAAKSYIGRLSQLAESKTVDFPSNTIQNKENLEKCSQGIWPSEGTSTNVLLLKLSRVSGSLVSSPRSTSEALYMGRKQKSHISSKTNKRSSEFCLPLKTRRVSTLSQSNSSKIIKRTGEFSSDSNVRQQRSVEAAVSGYREEGVINNIQHLHRESSQCHDTHTKNAQMQLVQNLGLDTLDNVDASFIIPKSFVEESQDLRLDTNDKAGVTASIKGNEMSMSQVMLDKQDKQTHYQLVNRGIESQAKATSAQESSVCLTSHEDQGIDIPRENSSTALDPLVPNQENKLASGGGEPSVSSASSASTISPVSTKDYHSKASDIEPVSGKLSFPLPFMLGNEGTQGMDMERNQHTEMDFINKPQQNSEYHPNCCFSWQSIMADTKQKPFPNLLVRPSISSFYAYSSLRTDATNTTPSLESPTDSILTRACSDIGSTSPSCGTPTQSSSNSILRLMGKDLMVVHNEESTQLPKVHSPATDSNSAVQCLPSPLGFTSYASVSNHDTLSFSVGHQSPSMTSSQAHNLLPCFHQRNMNHKANMTKEVIVVDDSDDVFVPRETLAFVPGSQTMFQRPFSYFPTHSHLLPRDNGIRPSNPINQGSSVPAPHLPRPFVFQSPSATDLNSPFYYPQSLR